MMLLKTITWLALWLASATFATVIPTSNVNATLASAQQDRSGVSKRPFRPSSDNSIAYYLTRLLRQSLMRVRPEDRVPRRFDRQNS